MMKNILMVLLIFYSSSLFAKEIVETWECGNFISFNKSDVLVKVQILKGRKEGKIYVSGTIYTTYYSVEGFNRRWDFMMDGNSDSNVSYALIMKPDGTASYYEFKNSDKTSPEMTFSCKKIE